MRTVFAKGYRGGWSEEIFKIKRISESRPPHVNIFKDPADVEIDGFFYEEELSRIKRT